MSEMVERVAQALWDLDQKERQARAPIFVDMNAAFFGARWAGKTVPWSHITGADVIESMAEEWRAKARAAIEAMREPTTAMVGVGKVWPGEADTMEGDPVIDNLFAVDRYRDMIDAALGEPK